MMEIRDERKQIINVWKSIGKSVLKSASVLVFLAVLVIVLPSIATAQLPCWNTDVVGNHIYCANWQANALLTVTVSPGGSAQKMTDSSGFAVLSFPFDIKGGDWVTVTDGTTTLSYLVHNITVDCADPDNDTISGTADSGTSVWVYATISGIEYRLDVWADASGHWVADYGAIGDILEGDRGTAWRATNVYPYYIGTSHRWTAGPCVRCLIAVYEQNQYGMWYSSQLYDHETNLNENISKWGCALTSLSMALNSAGHVTNPYVLNNWMIQPGNDGYTRRGWVRFDVTTKEKTENNLTFNSFRSRSTDQLRDVLCNRSYPVIAGVNLRPDGRPSHYVLVTGAEGNRLRISDPGRREHRYLDQYPSFETRGYVSLGAQQNELLMATDNGFSKLYLDVGDNVDLLIEDADGNRTGFDAETNQRVEEISQSFYFRDGIVSDESNGEELGRINSIIILQPSPEVFQVTITGLRSGAYELFTYPVAHDGSSQIIKFPGVADEGSASTFDIQYDPAPGSPVYVTRAATFESTIEDIENCYELGEIDNLDIANSLKKKIENAAKAAAKGNTRTSKKILNAFKNEVEAQKSKHISEIAAQILLEDSDYLNDQLQQ